MSRPPARLWDNSCPMGISYVSHVQGLSILMVQTYFEAGGVGVILAHPMTVSMLVSTSPAVFGKEFKWDGPTENSIEAGRLGGVAIWVNMAVPANEVLIVDDPESLQPTARIELVNFVAVPLPLDRMAQIR